jgi:hypothetical protein
MKREFMLYIRNSGDAKLALSESEHFDFIKKCEIYIGRLKATDNLIAAQPLLREGLVISRKNGVWETKTIDASREVQVGYYHIKANDIQEAVLIAQENPEFEYVPSATVEIRPIKTKEVKTNFVYPSS